MLNTLGAVKMHKFSRLRNLLLHQMSSFPTTKKIDPRFKNPCSELQQFIEVPLFKDNEIPFNPSIQDMKMAQKLFIPDKDHEIKFLACISETEKFPEHNLPEGQEQTVNFFQVGNCLCLVDMPGYGFRHPESFLKAVENYLKTRKNLKRTFLLVDGKVGFQKWDEVALDILEDFKIPYGLIMTKIDKAIPSQRLRNMLFLQQIRNKYTSVHCFPQPFMISSITGEGVAYLQAYIAHITGNLSLQTE
ncbi:GTP-binding protein 8-like isoform X3 [Stegodyphus dumicola]|uniref:GTP-binding protein 8-like isoform X3 n=1 Tax=Stegodyphus dumicola TaxID=202533 RepID=UPI0015A8B1DC|nr:GTP-binding protein 8-like isoform X3 [Stegodyphus dumicola]